MNVNERFESVAREYPESLAAARRAGVLLEMADLKAVQAVPDADNAARAFSEAAAILTKAQAKGPTRRSGWAELVRRADPKSVRKVAEALAPLEGALDAVVRSSLLPGWAPTYEPQDEGWAASQQTFEIRRALELLSQRGLLRSRMGDLRGALEDWGAGLRLARHVASEPFLVSGLVMREMFVIVTSWIERDLVTRGHDADYLKKLKEFFLSQPPVVEPITLLRGEAIVAHQFTIDPKSYRKKFLLNYCVPKEELKNVLPRGVSIDVLRYAYSTQVLKLFTEIQTQVDPNEDAQVQWRVVDEIDSKYNNPWEPTLALNRSTTSQYQLAWQSSYYCTALFRCFLGLLAALQYRLSEGKFPDELRDTGYEETDPYDGKPIRYRREGSEIRVYSVGDDLIDNGGESKLFRIPANGLSWWVDHAVIYSQSSS